MTNQNHQQLSLRESKHVWAKYNRQSMERVRDFRDYLPNGKYDQHLIAATMSRDNISNNVAYIYVYCQAILWDGCRVVREKTGSGLWKISSFIS